MDAEAPQDNPGRSARLMVVTIGGFGPRGRDQAPEAISRRSRPVSP
jgi:molybdopterin biosynthesis enzyme MoaB